MASPAQSQIACPPKSRRWSRQDIIAAITLLTLIAGGVFFWGERNADISNLQSQVNAVRQDVKDADSKIDAAQQSEHTDFQQLYDTLLEIKHGGQNK